MIRFEMPEVVVLCLCVWAVVMLFMSIAMAAEIGRMREFLKKQFPPDDDEDDPADWWKKGRRK